MSDPEMRKALQEREQAFQENMKWLDEDLDRRIREEDEKQRSYEDNLTWLDEDLKTKLDQRHQENIAWLDEDLNTKLDQRHQENIAWLDEDLNTKLDERKQGLLQEIQTSSRVTETQEQRTPKIWHCGHGVPWHFSGEVAKSRSTTASKHYEEGITENSCRIYHGVQQLQKRGNNTRRQYEKFHDEAEEGDIIFTHCSPKGGLTHWGIYTGEIINHEYYDSEKGVTHVHSHIMVYEWNPLPEVLKGTGRNSTLYEVKPTFKNYQNYSIPS